MPLLDSCQAALLVICKVQKERHLGKHHCGAKAAGHCSYAHAEGGEEEKVTLHGLRLQVAQGELLGICGEVRAVL